MVDKMVLGEKFRIEVNGKNLHQQDRKTIAYEYFSRRYSGQQRIFQSMYWFGLAVASGFVGILLQSFLSWVAFVLLVVCIGIGVLDFKKAVEFNFLGIDWGTKNMVRIDK